MSKLPSLSIPKHTTTLPCSGVEVSYRPFLVKEEKIMIIAESSKDDKEITEAIHQIIDNCTFGKMEIKELSNADLEWILLQIRIKSKGNTSELSFRCINEVKDDNGVVKECGFVNDISINLDDVKAKTSNTTNVIQLTDDIGIKMKEPSIASMEKAESTATNEMDKTFGDIVACIECVYSGEDVITAKELTIDEMTDFLDEFTQKQLNELVNWISNAMSIEISVPYVCLKCHATDNIVVKGIDNFFV
ncbi:MAG: hypothetical protein R8M45_03835 [Ghiorsea sp.]